MGLFRSKEKRQVVTYSMGRDGSAAVHASLSVCPDVNARQVYTLDRAKVANIILRGDEVPGHIQESDRILRRDLNGQTPFYFITLVHEPFTRHIQHCFYLLQNQTDADAIGYAIANDEAMAAHFESVPPSQTINWFEDEYKPATGIDVFDAPFDHTAGHREFRLGIHRLLLLSAHLPADSQTKIISDFLNARVPQIVPEKMPLDGLRDLYLAQILQKQRDRVANDFWQTPFSRHFFSPEQIGHFRSQIEMTSRQVLTRQNTPDHFKAINTRDRLLQDSLSPLTQVPHLTTEVSILVGRRGATTAASTVGSILRQMERAQNNLLLAALRGLAQDYPQEAAELGDAWLNPKPDDRILKAMTSSLQRSAQIIRPLAMLERLPERDAKLEEQRQRLAAQKYLLENPFAFSPRAQCGYNPARNKILYNPHQTLPYHTSGYATRTQGLARALRDKGYDVTLIARAGYPADTRVKMQGIDYDHDGVAYRFDHVSGRGQWDLPLDAYIEQAVEHLMVQARIVKPAILHTASNYICGMAGVEAARRLGIPSIYEMRGLWHITRWSHEPGYADTDKFALAQKLELECAAAADHVLVITGALKEWLIDHGIDATRITVAPNAVDLNQFQTREPDTAFARETGCTGKTVIGYIGSFVPYEGLDLLIQALAMLPENLRSQARLLWLGDGPALPGLLEQARQLGVDNHITSLGRRPFDEVPRAYSIVDIAVFPRKGQAICEIVSPLKPFEAMAMGKAVIASDVRPLKDIVTHGKTGLLHTKDDAVNLSWQLARLIKDKDLRKSCGDNARAWVESTRRWDQIAQTVTDVYGTLA